MKSPNDIDSNASLERALLESAASGDRRAFSKLVDLWLPDVRRLLFRLRVFQGEVDDLAQEVFVRVVDGLPKLRDPQRGRSWLYGICLRVTREEQRRAVRAKPPIGPSPPEVSPLALAEAAELEEITRKGLADLPSSLREVLVLSVYQGLTPQEISEVVGVSPGAVRHRLFRARREIEELLVDQAPFKGRSSRKA